MLCRWSLSLCRPTVPGRETEIDGGFSVVSPLSGYFELHRPFTIKVYTALYLRALDSIDISISINVGFLFSQIAAPSSVKRMVVSNNGRWADLMPKKWTPDDHDKIYFETEFILKNFPDLQLYYQTKSTHSSLLSSTFICVSLINTRLFAEQHQQINIFKRCDSHHLQLRKRIKVINMAKLYWIPTDGIAMILFINNNGSLIYMFD
jgi:hypothetical protein